MLDIFKARLKVKFSGVNLSQKRIDAIADRLHKKFPDLTEEADHDAKLEDYYDEDSLKEIAKQDDRVRTLEAQAKKGQQQTPNGQQASDEGNNNQQQDDTPAWAKTLIESNKALAAKVEGLEKEKATTTMLEKLAKHDKLKDVPKEFYDDRTLPTNDEGIEEFANAILPKWDAVKAKLPAAGVVGATRPGAGSGTANTGKVDNDVLAFAKKQAEKAQENNTVKP